MADRGNVSLVEEELGGMAPAIAALSVRRIERQHVVRCTPDGAEDAAGLDREGLVSFWERYARGRDIRK